MVGDAVAVEPVSTPKFSANREINREYFNFRPARGSEGSYRLMITQALSQIPYVTEQGIILVEQGILCRNRNFTGQVPRTRGDGSRTTSPSRTLP